MAWQHENQISFKMPIKVHINPNFRGKAMFSGVQGNGERPLGIHFNPHWKPKTQGLDITNKNVIENAIGGTSNHSLISNQRRTIHINPKVISNRVPQSISSLLQQEHLSANIVSTPIAAHEGEMEQKPIICQSLSGKRNAVTPYTNQQITQVNSFTKDNRMIDSPAQLNKFKKNLNSANSPTIRTAKIVRSKYKYLSNSALLHSAHPMLHNNRNSEAKTSTSCSRFKYVKKIENVPVISNPLIPPKSPIVSRFKLVKGSVTSGSGSRVINVAHALTPRRLRAQKILENIKSIPEHTVKSRFRLSKSMPQQTHGFKNRSLTNVPKSRSFSKYRFVRQTTPSQRSQLRRKSARAVKSRFKIVRGTRTQPTKTTSYHLFRNNHETPSYKQKVHQFISPIGRRNRWVNSRLDLQATKVVITNKKLLRIGRRPTDRLSKTDKIRKSKLLNIGGVFYRSTRTTLTRSSGAAELSCEAKHRQVNGQVLSIRGSKFVLDKTGRTLQRITSDKLPISRIHIGGVTFVPSSENTLVRSRVHEARNLVSQAKQRSIAFLTSKLRKNNQPCLIYQRLGKCRLHNKGACPKVHDPKKIAICNDFVNGKCLKSSAECPLSHDVGPEKMPTCHFFLEGCCVRDPCPYSHVKLNHKAAVCRDFLSGYCSAGDKCKKRHVFLCPEFEESKRCSKGKYCTYRHAGEVRPRTIHGRGEESTRKDPEGPTTSKEMADPLTRYYLKKEGYCPAGKLKAEIKQKAVILLPERSKLGDLPGFIPL